MNARKIEAVDLFCGAGGLTLGLERAGVDVLRGYDLDPSCEYPYNANTGAKFFKADVSLLDPVEIVGLFSKGAVRLVAGCAPCQTFSTYSRGSKTAAPTDSRWELITHFARIVKAVQPELVTMENVPRVAGFPVFDTFVRELREQKYHVWHEVVDCSALGAPQARKRLVLLASKFANPSAPAPVQVAQTVRDAIGYLPNIEAGKGFPDDPLHYSSALAPLTLKRLRATPPGGDWRDWPKNLQLDCHKRPSGRTYRGVYGRMKWDALAPTLTTLCGGVGNGRFVHPEQDRGISLREAAILQTFPETFSFIEPGKRLRPRTVARLVWDAVPPLLGQAIGKALLMTLSS
ncbi:MAG: DNA cytosine methyltransferase [Deltaproteobacteria bacterium]|nr:DNA cytosine methyltransferase [Deltaproteobacteria bacterium]